jgi:hypothetical protein
VKEKENRKNSSFHKVPIDMHSRRTATILGDLSLNIKTVIFRDIMRCGLVNGYQTYFHCLCELLVSMYQTAWSHILEDCDLSTCYCDSLRSHRFLIIRRLKGLNQYANFGQLYWTTVFLHILCFGCIGRT